LVLTDDSRDGTVTPERPALEIRGLRKRYGDREALAGVDLTARHGQLHGLLGPNGAGKTTLMRIALGLVARDAGDVHLLGCALDSTAGLPDGVAGLVESAAFYPYLSGRRNLALLSRLDGDATAGRRERVDLALEQVGLSGVADVAVGGYSAGMRQRLGLAAALIRRPRLLFLDEPTSTLDPAGAREIRTLAQDLAHAGTAIVWSSHDMAEVEELCAELTVIDHGRVVFSGTAEALRALAPPPMHALRTSDDRVALEVASERPGVKVKIASMTDDGLEVSADTEALDAYVMALGRAGVAVRALERRTRSLESLFLELTGHARADQIATAFRQQQGEAQASAVAS
jgi:ABC-2 type transport system ATP-binding protein